MNPVLHISSWPSVVESMTPRDQLRVGWLSGAYDANVGPVLEALRTRVPVTLEAMLFVEDEVADATTLVDLPSDLIRCSLRAPSAGHQLATLDLIFLPDTALMEWRDVLSNWALPPVIFASRASTGQLGLTVDPSAVDASAALGALMLLDPPTRRKSLDLLRGMVAVDAVGDVPCRSRVEGVFDSSYSLALVNRQLAMALDARGKSDVSLATFEQGAEPSLDWSALPVAERDRVQALWAKSAVNTSAPDVALRNAWPPAVQGMRGHLRVLANYHWEETRFPRAFAKQFNRTLDLITVGSSQTAAFLEDAGVKVPMAVVGDGVDHLREISPAALPAALPEGFNFLHVSSCFPRKAADVILAAFGEAFGGEAGVSLVIKTFPNPHNDIQQQVAAFQASFPDGPKVLVYEDDCSDEQLAALYSGCDAYVAPSRGEGFGLPLAEAMLHGLPVITSDWGGHRDFCSDQNSWLVPSTLTLADTHLSQPGSMWCEPSAGALAKTLREIFEADADTRATKINAARATAEALTWSAVAENTQRAIEQLTRQPGPLPCTRLGWVTTWGIRCGIASYSRHMTEGVRPGGELSTEIKLHVLAPRDDHPEVVDEQYVERCWQRGAIKPHRELIRHAVVSELDAVVVQYHWSFFSVSALAETIRALVGAGIQVFLDLHNTRGPPDGIADDADVIAALARCTRVLVHTLDDVARAESWGLRTNLTLLPLATYPVQEPSQERLTQLSSDYDLVGKTVIASYGFLMPHKGIIELVEALPAIREVQPDAHLLLVNALYSESVSGPVLEELERTIDRLDLSAHVTHVSDFLPDEESLALLKLAEVVVFPYRDSNESSSAAVRMAISGRCNIAITPVDVFSDIAAGCFVLPGQESSDLAEGLLDLLEKQSDQVWVEARRSEVDGLACEMDAVELSDRVMGMVQGCLRRLEVSS